MAEPLAPTPISMSMFGRLLRLAGFRVGFDQVRDALEAVALAPLLEHDDLLCRLRTVFVKRREELDVFEGAFDLFWYGQGRVSLQTVSSLTSKGDSSEAPDARRSAIKQEASDTSPEGHDDTADDQGLAASAIEVLREKDFEQMSAEELQMARQFIRSLSIPVLIRPSRRREPSEHGTRIDLAATLRRSARHPGGLARLVRSRRRTRRCPLVVICDISGSMSPYSRMLLHFVHALSSYPDALHAFVFATRLTNITRYLKTRRVDTALRQIAGAVEDWSGGTRIGRCLHQFNRHWLRRVLGQGAVVLLITDGLDRDVGEGLSREMERLQKSARRLIWLNPLLRYEHFEPKSLGMRAIVPYVDDLRSVHNLNSLLTLADVLSAPT